MRRTILAALGIGMMVSGAPRPAQAYAIDCAILLCLAGGWPSAGACIPARAEFIRRITPWPIEPPLQIWRCPMSTASLDEHLAPDRPSAVARAFGGVPGIEADLVRVADTPGADIDISGAAFDFVRSVRVFDIDWYEYDHENWEGEHDCRRYRSRVRVGSYDRDGAFAWSSASVRHATSEAWLGFRTRRDDSCSHAGRFRGVGVEWRDHEGHHGHEVVRY